MDFSIIDENLTENNLRDMFKKVSAMPVNTRTCELVVNIAEHSNASLSLIQKATYYIKSNIKNNYYLKNHYLYKLRRASIINQFYIKLKNKTLTEDKLRKIAEDEILIIGNNYTEVKILIFIAKHLQTSLELAQEIREKIINRVGTGSEYSVLI